MSYSQLQQLEALKEAAKNPGASGTFVGMGVGVGLGQQIINSANQINTTSSEDIASRLKNLKSLLDQGLITQDDFETKKKDILAKI